jgi:hypothetical protein
MPVALKRVCDITGTDSDVEVCDVAIAGQVIRLDLSPEGARRISEFFGAAITVRHPADGPAADGELFDDEEDDLDEDADEEDDDEEDYYDDDLEPRPAASKPFARRGRAATVMTSRRAPVRRPAVDSDIPDTSAIREWARANGFEVGDRGAIPGRIRSAYVLAHE